MPPKFIAQEENVRLAKWFKEMEEKGDRKCYFPCHQCKGLSTRMLLITIAQTHCR